MEGRDIHWREIRMEDEGKGREGKGRKEEERWRGKEEEMRKKGGGRNERRRRKERRKEEKEEELLKFPHLNSFSGGPKAVKLVSDGCEEKGREVINGRGEHSEIAEWYGITVIPTYIICEVTPNFWNSKQ